MDKFTPLLTFLRRRAFLLFFFLLAYGITYSLSVSFYIKNNHSTVMWLNNGLGLGVLVLVGYRLWPALIVLMLATHFTLTHGFYFRSLPLCFSLLAGSADVLESTLMAFFVRRWLPDLGTPYRLKKTMLRVGVVMVCTAFTAFIGASAVRCGYSPVSYWLEYRQWFLGNIVGTLLVAPAVAGWRTLSRESISPGSMVRHLFHVGLLLILTGLLAQLAFGGNPTSNVLLATQFPYLLVLVLLWVSIYFPPRVVGSMMLLATLILTANTIRGNGPFNRPGLPLSWLTLNIQLFLGLSSLISLMISMITEERRLCLKEVVIKEALYQGIVDDQTELICRGRPDSTLIFVNEAFCRYFGKDREELIGTSLSSLVPHEDRQSVLTHFADITPEQPVHSYEHRILLPGGGVRWQSWTSRGIFNDQGQILEVLAVGRDITEKKHAEEALQAVVDGTSRVVGEDFFRNLVYQLAHALEMRFAIICKFLPGTPIKARTLAFWSGEGFAEDFESDVRDMPCTDMAHHAPCIHLHGVQEVYPDSNILKTLNVEACVGIPLQNTAKNIVGSLIVMHDRPIADSSLAVALLNIFAARGTAELERMQAEQLLRDNLRRKDEFLAMLAHELRNPLAPIRYAVQISKIQSGGDPLLERPLSIIDRQVEHMARLVDDLLEISRLTRGRVQIKRSRLAVVDVLTRAIEAANPLIGAQRRELLVSFPSPDLKLEGDMVRLTEAVGNLLTNAAKYTDPGGRIWLDAVQEGCDVVIRVRDSGVGIAPEMLPRVFELFAQADHSLDRSKGGLGIGLTISKQVIELHGGSITAHSEGPGKGAEFIIRLPALLDAFPAEPCPQEMVATDSTNASARILVVDDMLDAAQSLAQLLTLWGHEVRTAYEGSIALETMRSFKPEVVILDIGLPGVDGYEVARRLRKEYGSGFLLAALTGYGEEHDAEKARQAGFDCHLVKPVAPATLHDLLSRQRAPTKQA